VVWQFASKGCSLFRDIVYYMLCVDTQEEAAVDFADMLRSDSVQVKGANSVRANPAQPRRRSVKPGSWRDSSMAEFDMTHSWQDVTWLIRDRTWRDLFVTELVRDMTRLRHESFVISGDIWLICDLTHSWLDSFVTELIRDMNHLRHVLFVATGGCAIWLIRDRTRL